LSKNLNEQDILLQIAELDEMYKDKSRELVECTSFSKEQKIKEEMSECEVLKRVLKRKLDSIQREVAA
jgi:hypothetical protein